ncbi:MAG: ribonuclease P protein component [Planctomycetaceae bacterium]
MLLNCCQGAFHVITSDHSLDDRFSKHQRLRTTAEFRRCYDGGVRAGDDNLLIFVKPNELPHSRLGISVSRKHGNAVMRNRKKRLLREAFRLSQHDLPAGLDLVLVPRQHPASRDDYMLSLRRLVNKAARRCQSAPQPEPVDAEAPK